MSSRGFAQKQIAITIDDLILGGGFISLEHTEQVNQKIIQSCLEYGVPAIGFVNEGKLDRSEKARRIAILQNWVDAGLSLGNHTYSHPSLSRTPLHAYQEDVIKGETITRRILSEANQELTYFRHPFLHTGPDSLTKAAFEKFLSDKGYVVAPVTAESSDYIFNKIYVDAIKKKDTAMMKEIGAAYLVYTKQMIQYFEGVSDELFVRQVAQTFLCHVNAINADYLDDIFSHLQSIGYQFVTLPEALKDEAYLSKDHYIGTWGISWFYRWDEKGTKQWLEKEPEVDQKWLDLYNN